MATTYTQWKVGDIIDICASIDDFCSVAGNYIFANDINVTKQPNACSVTYGSNGGCGLHFDNIELTFKLVKCITSTQGKSCSPDIIYKTLGSVRTNSNGVAGVRYTVTDQDRLNYESQIIDNSYKVMACITNSDGQTTRPSLISITTDSITISPSHLECVNNVCTRVNTPGTDTCSTEGSTTECLQPTHYIEYDFSILPTDFINLISNNIIFISDNIGNYLPLGSNIQYQQTTYDSLQKKFRLYFRYTPLPSPSSPQILTPHIPYNQNNKIIALVDITDMVEVAAYVTGILILILVVILGLLNPWIAVFGIALGIALLYFKLVEIENNATTNGSGPSTPQTQVETVQDFIDNYLDTSTDNLTPQCKCPPQLTCTVDDMLFYLGGRATARYAQCIHAHAKKGDADTYCSDTIKTEIDSIKNDLINGIITVQEACTRLENNIVTPVKVDVDTVITDITCDTGYTWNPTTQKCEKICNFPLLNQCLDTPIYIGCALIIGYTAFKLLSSKK